MASAISSVDTHVATFVVMISLTVIDASLYWRNESLNVVLFLLVRDRPAKHRRHRTAALSVAAVARRTICCEQIPTGHGCDDERFRSGRRRWSRALRKRENGRRDQRRHDSPDDRALTHC